MQLSSVLLARVLAFFEMADLNPRGRLFFRDLVPLLIERFRFSTYPQKPEDFDESKGIVFANGFISGNSIDKITIWNDGIGFDVRSSTDEGENILRETFEWLRDIVDINYNDKTVTRWGYLSQLTFHSEIDMLNLSPAITRLCARVSENVEGPRGSKFTFRPVNLAMTFDRHMCAFTQAPFGIQRRAGAPFEENKYFSEAPLPTNIHLELLQEFEDELQAQRPRSA
jgi:hypothetical protein